MCLALCCGNRNYGKSEQPSTGSSKGKEQIGQHFSTDDEGGASVGPADWNLGGLARLAPFSSFDVADAETMGTSGLKTEEEDCDAEMLNMMAEKIEGKVKKYPKSGSRFLGFKGLQERYIAVIPGTLDEGDVLSERKLWRRGRLAYWENQIAFKQGQVPKGEINLLRIAKVAHNKEKHKGCEVVVKHKDAAEARELVLVFSTQRDAEEWELALWSLIKELRKGQPAK